jgi:7-carboxy-7-deazaguanine synthase
MHSAVCVPTHGDRLNLQVIEKPTIYKGKDAGKFLDIVSVFKTIQGEGPFAGVPAVFVRLAGCNLQCPGCDTNYTEGRETLDIDTIIERVEEQAGERTTLVVITGGEPFRQPLGRLVHKLLGMRFEIQVETNGTLFDTSIRVKELGDMAIVCSPKAGINSALMQYVTSYKYVLRAGEIDPTDGLPTHALDSKARPGRPARTFKGMVFLQPYDEGDAEKNLANLRACVASCLEYGYTLCIQLHKLPGVELP